MRFAGFEHWARRWRILRARRVATIATMPSRAATFALVVARILPQVDEMFVYLDGFDKIPRWLEQQRKIKIARSQDHAPLRAAGRFLALEALREESVVIVVDDDIRYPRNYVSRLAWRLAAAEGRAVVGVHGGLFRPPYRSYVTDAQRFHFRAALERERVVDELGAGTAAFLSSALSFDVRRWDASNNGDLRLALEAQARGLPRICVARKRKWLRPLSENQADSLWLLTKANPTPANALMRELMREAIERFEASDGGRA